MQASIYTIDIEQADGSKRSLEDFKDNVLLIVNTASKCGFTPQYKGLQALYEAYADKGLVILGFPCNQFLSQEPGSQDEINQFCELNFGVSFPLMKKIDVNGEQEAPIYTYLKSEARGIFGSKRIKWNFTKFLVSKDGQSIKRFGPRTEPEAMEQDIKKFLAL